MLRRGLAVFLAAATALDAAPAFAGFRAPAPTLGASAAKISAPVGAERTIPRISAVPFGPLPLQAAPLAETPFPESPAPPDAPPAEFAPPAPAPAPTTLDRERVIEALEQLKELRWDQDPLGGLSADEAYRAGLAAGQKYRASGGAPAKTELPATREAAALSPFGRASTLQRTRKSELPSPVELAIKAAGAVEGMGRGVIEFSLPKFFRALAAFGEATISLILWPGAALMEPLANRLADKLERR